ncbi:estradiol 17-beta-dehydrogenase 8-like [Actinia tenebrosa]|uniref:(3R)-3-hydroxyacyl-CoA dehydrogenase n=1 Tax=Actinia tenebrosa TaxID=6105 RepID=A0A6P8IUC2_ACTTE|nr:estradiol 17-beta-dehydrogenase 8-like [Actinia tenebrosa]
MAAANGLLLSGRLALVTGGASGIGRAICQTLAKAGASVAVVDRNIEGAKETGNSLSKNDGNQLHSYHATDVVSSLQVNKLILKVQEDHQRPPCILVNSAGITRDAFFLKMNEEAFDEVIDVNLKGTFLMSQFASKAMVESKISNGSIINIASIVGKTGNIGQANYTASKAGVEGLTRTCALELARFGIRCNAVLPGFIHSPMTEKIPEQITQKIVKMVPLSRIGQPSEIAEVVNFLASDLSSYITGASIEVTGGLSM